MKAVAGETKMEALDALQAKLSEVQAESDANEARLAAIEAVVLPRPEPDPETVRRERQERAEAEEVALYELAFWIWPTLHLHDGRVDGLRSKLRRIGMLTSTGPPRYIERCRLCGRPKAKHDQRHAFALLDPLDPAHR